ncbi:hypothetical protein Y032_0191g1332 [Ancylostoma ceylanicum]|uniref:Uncharacterized protein n=1 Tax=Ancylostoma ceylanicum TaxID=53326 RepID=A0A016SPV4_9BILA|nr:hypothetical protein Y032_0191g1332 [Ancylostoma ceylanicum]
MLGNLQQRDAYPFHFGIWEASKLRSNMAEIDSTFNVSSQKCFLKRGTRRTSDENTAMPLSRYGDRRRILFSSAETALLGRTS